MNILPSYPYVILMAVMAVIFGLTLCFNSRHREALEALACSLGLLFSAEGPTQCDLEATGLEIFRQGRSRKASNLIQLSVPSGRLRIFDYEYVTGGGRGSAAHPFTLALIDCGGCPVPDFDLKPESLIYKIGEIVGFKDIDLPAFPVFSDKYRLTGPDEAAVRMFFTPDRAAWFERNLGLRVQGANGHAVMFKRAGVLPAEAWPGFIEEAKAFATEVLR